MSPLAGPVGGDGVTEEILCVPRLLGIGISIFPTIAVAVLSAMVDVGYL